ncbi:hypothetical protein BH24ACT3_BH24ACT3_09390 [soil metagenome]
MGSADSSLPLRVLHVSQPVVDGVAHYLLNLFEDQVRRGWHVALACPGGMLGERSADLEVRGLPGARLLVGG